MHHRIEITPLQPSHDPRAKLLLDNIRSFLRFPVNEITTRDVYSIFANLSQEQLTAITQEIHNPIIYKSHIGESRNLKFDWLIQIGFRPGVTDNLASTAKVAINDVIGDKLTDEDLVFSSIEYLVSGSDLNYGHIHQIANSFLANELIQTISIFSYPECQKNGIPINKPEVNSQALTRVERIRLDGTDSELLKLSSERQLALSIEELISIRTYFKKMSSAEDRKSLGLGSDPTDVELEVLAQTWSEHCKHKIFDAVIEYHDEDGNCEVIDSLYKSYIKKSTYELEEEIDWLVSVFSDNAGVISFNDDWDLVYKVETHNSPSALDPYGGAITGIVGVNRDPMGTGLGADLLINVWGYCFASPFFDVDQVPEGLLHPHRIREGVHKGVIDGGNQSGIPYGLGWEYFDDRYLGKPLVFCGTIGKLPKKILGKPGFKKEILPGDFIVMAGGRIGKDGIHGATFSSEELKQSSSAQAVQIGDPITQKKLSDFIIEGRDRGFYRFITDNGAGGLSSSVGEMAVHSNGCELDLTFALLKYHGLQPWEILLSESQERMSFAVLPEKVEAFKELAATRDVEVSVLGKFTDTGKFHVLYQGNTVAYIDLDYMHKGYPRMRLRAEWQPPKPEETSADSIPKTPLGELLISLLKRMNVGSFEKKARQYDHEVKGLSVIKPFIGVKRDIVSDATVFMISPTSKEGVVLAHGVAPRYSDIDTFHMTASVIDLAIRRTIAVGGRLGSIAAIDNFCWPDPVESQSNPDGPYKLAQLVRSNKALYQFTKAFKVPCISGKDSMKNDSVRGGKKISVPPTLLFSTIAKMDDISQAVTLEAKMPGDLVYVLGETKKELGGSEYLAMLGQLGNEVPKVQNDDAITLYQKVSKLIGENLCHSVHTPALGGLGVGFAKIAIGGRLGLMLDLTTLEDVKKLTCEELLFSESNCRFVITIPDSFQDRVEEILKESPYKFVGKVTTDPFLTIQFRDNKNLKVPLEELVAAYTQTLP